MQGQCRKRVSRRERVGARGNGGEHGGEHGLPKAERDALPTREEVAGRGSGAGGNLEVGSVREEGVDKGDV